MNDEYKVVHKNNFKKEEGTKREIRRRNQVKENGEL